MFPRLVTLSSLGMLQVRWQTDAREVEVPPPHRRLFGRNGFIEPWMCLFDGDAAEAGHLLVEDAHRENSGTFAAALASKHVDAGRRPRAGVRTPAPAFQSALSRQLLAERASTQRPKTANSATCLRAGLQLRAAGAGLTPTRRPYPTHRAAKVPGGSGCRCKTATRLRSDETRTPLGSSARC